MTIPRRRQIAVFFGIDPGQSGGLAAIHWDGTLRDVTKMPSSMGETYAWIADMAASTDYGLFGMIEQLGGMPRKPVKVRCRYCKRFHIETRAMQSPTTMFKLGVNYGKLLATLSALQLRYEEVLPKIWQKEFGLIVPKGATHLVRGKRRFVTITDKKNMHKQKAQRLHPDLKVTHAIADALLIAEYARRAFQKRAGRNPAKPVWNVSSYHNAKPALMPTVTDPLVDNDDLTEEGEPTQ